MIIKNLYRDHRKNILIGLRLILVVLVALFLISIVLIVAGGALGFAVLLIPVALIFVFAVMLFVVLVQAILGAAAPVKAPAALLQRNLIVIITSLHLVGVQFKDKHQEIYEYFSSPYPTMFGVILILQLLMYLTYLFHTSMFVRQRPLIKAEGDRKVFMITAAPFFFLRDFVLPGAVVSTFFATQGQYAHCHLGLLVHQISVTSYDISNTVGGPNFPIGELIRGAASNLVQNIQPRIEEFFSEASARQIPMISWFFSINFGSCRI